VNGNVAAPAGRAQLAKRRVQATLVVLIGLLAAVLAVGVFAIHSLYQSAEERYVRQALPLQAATRDIVLQMVNQETGVRGYMITTDRRSLGPYFVGHRQARKDLAAITAFSDIDPELGRLVPRLRSQIRSLNGYFARQIVFVADGRIGLGRARKDVLGGQTRFERFRATAGAMRRAIDTFVTQTRAHQRRTYRRTLGGLIAAGAGGLLIAIALLLRVPEQLRLLYAAEEDARARAERGANAARALSHVDDAVILLDEEGSIRFWNRAAETLFGVPATETVDRRGDAVIPELSAVEAAATGSHALVPIVIAGEERWVVAAVAHFDDGRVLTLRDVTAEQALERARADFVATASHELRTPLSAVYGAASTLLQREGRLDGSDRRRLLKMIEQEAERLSGIVDQILVTAQLDRGELRLADDELDVRAMAESVLESAEARNQEHIALELSAPEGVLPLQCDSARLRQVLVNLVENAIKYSPDGGRVQVLIHDDARHVQIDVTDEGLGIPVTEQERIFEKFYRLDAEMTRGVGGSGLGLYISREIIEQMGGRISVDSTPGGGSTFSVELPRR
jgi:PAS domain S-box-containing protein